MSVYINPLGDTSVDQFPKHDLDVIHGDMGKEARRRNAIHAQALAAKAPESTISPHSFPNQDFDKNLAKAGLGKEGRRRAAIHAQELAAREPQSALPLDAFPTQDPDLPHGLQAAGLTSSGGHRRVEKMTVGEISPILAPKLSQFIRPTASNAPAPRLNA